LKLFELFKNVTIHQTGPNQPAHASLSSRPDPHPPCPLLKPRHAAHPRLRPSAPGHCRSSTARRSKPGTPHHLTCGHHWAPLFPIVVPPLKGIGCRHFPPFTLSLTRAISVQNDKLETSSRLFLDRLSAPPPEFTVAAIRFGSKCHHHHPLR
jgi:hypothetical protein